jgi:hypothetical protein
VITLVAVVLLFVVGAMAVLAIDLATFYTARSEAQLAADSAALAAARVLANSGMTSNPADANLVADARQLATTLALQVATHNQVGGRDLVAPLDCTNAKEVCISFNVGDPKFGTNPHVTVTVTRADLPTFFARIFGSNLVTVKATAVAEAYNPSGFNVAAGGATPVAPNCVKPWVLPNLSPDPGHPGAIFNPTTGAIQNASTLLGWQDTSDPPLFYARCTGSDPSNLCSGDISPLAWRYYPGAPSSFPPPTQALPGCSDGFQPYQMQIAGCVTKSIACNQPVDLDLSDYELRNRQTSVAVNCLTHCQTNKGDQVPTIVRPLNQSFQFLAGDDNPIAGAAGKNVLVSDSLVTVPVYNSDASAPVSPVTIIGFVQLFLNWDGQRAQEAPPHPEIKTTIVNLIGCGTSATGIPILGNGPSPVAVRLIHP